MRKITMTGWMVAVFGLVLAASLPAEAAEQGATTRPTLNTAVRPVYPQVALGARTDATLITAITVLPDGTVGDVAVLQNNRPRLGFDEAIRDAILQWKFAPAMRDGKRVPSFEFMKVVFQSAEAATLISRDSLSFSGQNFLGSMASGSGFGMASMRSRGPGLALGAAPAADDRQVGPNAVMATWPGGDGAKPGQLIDLRGFSPNPILVSDGIPPGSSSPGRGTGPVRRK